MNIRINNPYGSYGLAICMTIQIADPYVPKFFSCTSYSSSSLAMNNDPTSPYTPNDARTPLKTKYALKMTLTEAT